MPIGGSLLLTFLYALFRKEGNLQLSDVLFINSIEFDDKSQQQNNKASNLKYRNNDVKQYFNAEKAAMKNQQFTYQFDANAYKCALFCALFKTPGLSKLLIQTKKMVLYKVEAILDKMIDETDTRYGKIWYKVKWLGYPQEQASWEPLCNLSQLRQIIDQFEKNLKNTNLHNSPKTSQKKNSAINTSKQNAVENQPPKDAQSQQQIDLQPKSSSKNQRRIWRYSKVPKISKLTAQRLRLESNLHKTCKAIRPKFVDQKSNKNEFNNSQQVANKQVQVLQKRSMQIPQIQDVGLQSDELRDFKFTIKELYTNNESKTFFLAQEYGQTRWVAKSEVLRDHPYALIQFYQTRINLIPKTTSKDK